MRILHILDHSLPLQSGYVSRTLGIIGAQRARGWEPVLLTTPRQNTAQAPFEDVGGWRFHRTAAPGPLLGRLPVVSYAAEIAATNARLRGLIAESRPDVLHAHSPALNGVPALRLGRQFGLPVVYEVRALWEDAGVEAGTVQPGSARYRATRALETHVAKRAGAITVLCEGVRREMLARGVPEERTTVIPNAVTLADFPPAAPPDPGLKAALGLSDARVLGFIGSFYVYEGLANLVRAMPAILARLPLARLLLVGDGPVRPALEELVGELGLGDRVVFTGRVPFSHIGSYYDLVDMFVYPRLASRLTDLVTPIKPLEAMAKAKPVLASDCGGHRELIADGRTGVLFKADDPQALATAAVLLASEPERWPALGAAARAFVEAERTWEASVARYAPVYARLTSASAPKD